MQKLEKMDGRISGWGMAPVMVVRWWMVSRTSWATRSPGRLVGEAVDYKAQGCGGREEGSRKWRALVTMTASGGVGCVGY